MTCFSVSWPCSTGTRGGDGLWRRCPWKWEVRACVCSKQHEIGHCHWWGGGTWKRKKPLPETSLCSRSQKTGQVKWCATARRDSCSVFNPQTQQGHAWGKGRLRGAEDSYFRYTSRCFCLSQSFLPRTQWTEDPWNSTKTPEPYRKIRSIPHKECFKDLQGPPYFM